MKIISLGLGVQSTALYYMSSMGEVERVDYAIFADTGREKKGTLQYLKFLQKWQKENNGVPIIVVRKKNLYRDLISGFNSWGGKFSSIPAFFKNEDGTKGMLQRQCTKEYKVLQVDAMIREILEVKRVNQPVEVWKGITMDEIERLSIPERGWKIHVYPFCSYQTTSKETTRREMGIRATRTDLIAWYERHNLPIPPKSSCTFCPYQGDASWYEMKKNQPADWKSAVLVDRAIRNSTKKGIKSQAFLHSSCIPLEDIVFSEGLPDLWHGECSGNCHT